MKQFTIIALTSFVIAIAWGGGCGFFVKLINGNPSLNATYDGDNDCDSNLDF